MKGLLVPSLVLVDRFFMDGQIDGRVGIDKSRG